MPLLPTGIRENPDIGISTSTINPVVGECSDSFLNDMQGRHVRQEHVFAAIDSARTGPVAEGAVGAGTGMSSFGFKGGIGTSSRIVPEETGGWSVGVLVLANFGRKRQLTIDGVPVGQILDAGDHDPPERGSIMFIVATDAPLLDRGLRRLARRCAIGLGRTGSISGDGSGDYVIAFSTAEAVRVPHEPTAPTMQTEIVLDSGGTIDHLFQAAVEATEEAIVNALLRATSLTGRDGNHREALPIERVLSIMRDAGKVR